MTLTTRPIKCSACGGKLKKISFATARGIGCALSILGVALIPLLGLGLILLFMGLHHLSKRERFWECRQCGTRVPRAIRWYELG